MIARNFNTRPHSRILGLLTQLTKAKKIFVEETHPALGWLVGPITAIFFVIRPQADWPPVANRKRAAALFLAIFLGFPLIEGAIVSADQARKHPSSPAEQHAAEQQAPADERAREALSDMRSRPTKYLSLDGTKAWKDGFDTVFMLSGEIRSTSKLGIKDR
jgi:hypothetical protein